MTLNGGFSVKIIVMNLEKISIPFLLVDDCLVGYQVLTVETLNMPCTMCVLTTHNFKAVFH